MYMEGKTSKGWEKCRRVSWNVSREKAGRLSSFTRESGKTSWQRLMTFVTMGWWELHFSLDKGGGGDGMGETNKQTNKAKQKYLHVRGRENRGRTYLSEVPGEGLGGYPVPSGNWTGKTSWQQLVLFKNWKCGERERKDCLLMICF